MPSRMSKHNWKKVQHVTQENWFISSKKASNMCNAKPRL